MGDVPSKLYIGKTLLLLSTMSKKLIQIFAIVFTIALFSPIISVIGATETAGTHGGTLECNTNLQLIPQAGEVGGGNIRWRLTGATARDLRRALIMSVGDGEGHLTEEQLNKYLQTNQMLESYVQRGTTLDGYRESHAYTRYGFTPQRDIDPDDQINYHGLKITRSSLTTNNVHDDTVGLVGSTAQDTSSLEIKFTISFHEAPGVQEYNLNMADHRVMTALFDSIIIPAEEVLIENAGSGFETEFELEHGNLLVKDGDVQARLIRFDSGGNHTVLTPPEDYNYVVSEDGSVELLDGFEFEEGDELRIFYGYGVEWTGNSKLSHWTYFVGTHSYYEPVYEDGTLYVIRTPAGQLLHYSADYEGYDEPRASIRWKQFNVLENPQILFVIVALASYFTVKVPKTEFKKYRDVYHPSKKAKAEKDTFTHIFARVLSLVILIIYFVPSLGPIFISGLYLVIIAAAFVVSSIVISKVFYKHKSNQIPLEDTKPPVKKKIPTTPADRKVKKPSNVKKHKCNSCREIFTIPINKNLLTVKCPACKKSQRELKEGYNYLFLEDKGDKVFSILSEFVKDGQPGMVVTTKIPSKIREKFSLQGLDIKWLSDHASNEHDVLDPTRLEFDLVRAISNFSRENERGIILLDGLEYLIVENGFERVSKLLKKTTDTCSFNATTYLIHLNPSSMSKAELSITKKEFDHVEDLRTKKKF